jgi:hypothetical protein
VFEQVGKVFEEIERPVLQPLPVERFAFFREAERSVHRDAHVEVDKACYSVPPEYVGCKVWARWDGHTVHVFNRKMEQIADHAKREPGRFGKQPQHIAPEKISCVERGTVWLLNKAKPIGPHSGRWAEQMLSVRGIEGVRVLIGLISLFCGHPYEAIERACEIAHSRGAYRLRDVRTLIHRQASRQERSEFAQEHPIIRSLSEYGELVWGSFTKTRSTMMTSNRPLDTFRGTAALAAPECRHVGILLSRYQEAYPRFVYE